MKKANRTGYLAPPKGAFYIGRPVRLDNIERAREVLIALDSMNQDIGDMERERNKSMLKSMDQAQLWAIFKGNGFTLVKRKELKVDKLTKKPGIPPSAGVPAMQTTDERGFKQFIHLTSLA